MAPHFVLFEHAAGYALFKLKEFEEVATFLPQVEESVLDVSKFSQVSLSSTKSVLFKEALYKRGTAS
jgi:hypothetical protein